MIAVLCVLRRPSVASAFVCPSHAVITIALPNKIESGTSVTVQWTRDDADPLSFGLMQRSLEGNNPILSVTAVTNDAGATSGIASVLFNTPGLAPGETPNQLFAGTQVAVTRGNRGSSGPGVDTGTIPTSLPAVTTTLVAVSIHTISSTTTASINSRSTALAPATKSSTSLEGISSSLPSGGPIPPPTISFTGSFAATAAPSLALTIASPQSTVPNANSTGGGTASAARARKRGMPRAAVIALAVLLPLLTLLLCVLLCCCRARRPTRHRISQFTDFFLRAHAARELDCEAARAPAQPVREGPVHVPPTRSPAPPPPPSPPSPRWHQKVAYLAAHNAILQRGLLSRSPPSGPVSVGDASVDGEPPPVYVESEDAIRSQQSR
ncbi:hypothetical protein GGX14DRAFT_406049 [Mycena pura]|uniref:Uncharacterized protein n=1 Tax=Mycena pura TaxID=153505 RepID=A0AAD6UUB3_9AGAR|nr:hypothetical protein GGX14DRAFT_406049 [Mycena pura]